MLKWMKYQGDIKLVNYKQLMSGFLDELEGTILSAMAAGVPLSDIYITPVKSTMENNHFIIESSIGFFKPTQ